MKRYYVSANVVGGAFAVEIEAPNRKEARRRAEDAIFSDVYDVSLTLADVQIGEIRAEARE